MKAWFKLIGIVLLICLFFSPVVGCKMWRYSECKKVGHSTLYCMLPRN